MKNGGKCLKEITWVQVFQGSLQGAAHHVIQDQHQEAQVQRLLMGN